MVIFTCVLGERYSFGKFIATPNFVHDFTFRQMLNNKFVNVYLYVAITISRFEGCNKKFVIGLILKFVICCEGQAES